MRKFHDRIIKVDGEETYLLSHFISDNGIVIVVSGPESLLLKEHIVTEYDGSPLDLSKGHNLGEG